MHFYISFNCKEKIPVSPIIFTKDFYHCSDIFSYVAEYTKTCVNKILRVVYYLGTMYIDNYVKQLRKRVI